LAACVATACSQALAVDPPAADEPPPLPVAAAPLPGDPQGGPPPTKAPVAAPSQNVTINLINRLVQRGVLTQADAEDLIKQAEQDAERAKSQAAAVQQAAAEVAAAQAPTNDDTLRVPYVPQIVKQEITEQVKQEVMKQAKDENWAAPNAFDSWVSRWHFTGDVRFRYEGNYFPSGNDNTGAFPIFNSINTGSPFDTSGTVFSPKYDVDQNRTRLRIRARLGADVDLGDGFSGGIRFGSGQDDSPVSENQTLGLANNGQGGDFGKYQLWLDRAFIRYDIWGEPKRDVAILFGRFDNPFFTTSSMIWENEIAMDGVALSGKYEVFEGFTPFIVGGAFPVFNTDFNYATNNPSKFKSVDKYLYAGQVGVDWKISKDINFKVGGAFYDFENIEGKLSDPFVPLTPSDAGDTDDTRPSFAQNGNTYMALRDITPTAANGYGTTMQYQYFGLATPFRVLALSAKLDYNHFEPYQISLYGEYAKNLAFDYDSINAIAVNNRGPNSSSGALGSYAGGDQAWTVGIRVGHPSFEKAGDWSLDFNYRHVESDAVVDSFTDVNFGTPLSGTNLQGYTVGAAVAVSPRVRLGLRWMSASAIVGPTFKADLLQFDIVAKF